jgi:pimeloyl-ACP methyl ester carboxylesterase
VNNERTIVMVPGYNEPPAHFDILVEGRKDFPGLRAHGFDCLTFPQQDDRLRDRIDRFAAFLLEVRALGYAFPVILLGYSLGGLVVRGFLRAYPHRAHEVSHAIMISTPNWGVETFVLPQITRMMRVPDCSMSDMNLNSDFMVWLNGTAGHWDNERDLLHRDWVLDREPWIAPDDVRLLTIMGLIPARGGDNDGLVYADSVTLGSRIPAHYVIGKHCNHMNVIGHFDPLIFFSKGFFGNDRVWPHTLRAILRFTQAQLAPVANGYQRI